MKITLSLTKQEYEATLLELVSRAMQRVVRTEDVESITVSYNPKSDSVMNVVLKFESPSQQHE